MELLEREYGMERSTNIWRPLAEAVENGSSTDVR